MNPQESRWTRLQRGQALVEYWATIPAAVAIMIGAAIVASFVNSVFLHTANVLDNYCASLQQPADMVATIYSHSVESSGYSYDPNTNRTTVAYTVTSGTQPSISHWILGVPKEIADHVLQTSESWSWTDSDPTTGAMGMKFDTGYNPTSSTDTGGGKGGGKGSGKSSDKGRQRPQIFAMPLLSNTSATEVRVITITLDGLYEFGNLTVTVKAGNTEIGTGTVSGPIALQQNTDNSGVDRSKGC